MVGSAGWALESVAVDAIGLWFLLSHRVEVEEADDEVADMTMGSRSELAELGRVEPAEGGHLADVEPPQPIFSLLTLLGREEADRWSSS